MNTRPPARGAAFVPPPADFDFAIRGVMEYQGELLSLRFPHFTPPRPRHGRTRGRVFGFSRKSRLRLMRLFATLSKQDASFITLTYGNPAPAPARAKEHLRAFYKRLKRMFLRMSFVWKAELQKRGAIHFHIIAYGLPYVPQAILLKMWRDVTKVPSGLNVKRVAGNMIGYVAKYSSKESFLLAKETAKIITLHQAGVRGVLANLFIYAPYLAALCKLGRIWGVLGDDCLPYAPKTTIDYYQHPSVWKNLGRGLNKAFKRYKRPPLKTAIFFTRDAPKWHDYLVHLSQLAPPALIYPRGLTFA